MTRRPWLVAWACVASLGAWVDTAHAQASPTPSPHIASPIEPTTELSSVALEPEQVQSLLAKHKNDPPVDDVVRAALAAGATAPQQFASMLQRARLRGLLPTLELGARRGQAIDLRPASGSDLEAVNLSTADSLTLMASARFEFGRLLYANEEVGIQREQRAARARRAELARVVVELYFRRQRLQLERDLRGGTDIDHEVRIAEAEALLDAFTNGAFKRMMIARRSTAWTTTAVNTNASKPP